VQDGFWKGKEEINSINSDCTLIMTFHRPSVSEPGSPMLREGNLQKLVRSSYTDFKNSRQMVFQGMYCNLIDFHSIFMKIKRFPSYVGEAIDKTEAKDAAVPSARKGAKDDDDA
jgi:hypothetical protein